MSETIFQKAIEQHLKRRGLRLGKKISSGGFFTSPTYDYRKVYSQVDLNHLNREGFKIDEDIDIWLFNALEQYEPSETHQLNKKGME